MHRLIPTAHDLYFTGKHRDSGHLEELEKVFFTTLGLPNRTYKTTYHRRLDDLNALVAGYLPAARPLEVMDVAVSSGISTVEWLDALQSAGIECQMTAGDLSVNAFLISLGHPMRMLVDRSGHPLQLEVRGHAIRTPLRRRDAVRYALPMALLRRATRRLLPDLAELRGMEVLERRFGPWPLTCRPLKLVSPSLVGRHGLEVVEDNILLNKKYVHCFHVLRAANILNDSYFAPDILSAMVANLRTRLRDGGLLIVCRTDSQGHNSGTLFSLDADRSFRVLARLNEGSDIESLVLGLPAAR